MYNNSMLTVKETPEFIHFSKGVWTDEERHEFIDWIALNPNVGDVIVGSKALRKVRFARQGLGKSGGARVIYFNRRADGVVVLLLVYAKAKFDNIRTEILNKLKEKYDV
jgi:hypothetical protein